MARSAHKYTRPHSHTHVFALVYIDWKPQTDAQLTGFSLLQKVYNVELGIWNEARAIIGKISTLSTWLGGKS